MFLILYKERAKSFFFFTQQLIYFVSGVNVLLTLPNIFAAENRKILHEQETEKMLIHLLSHDSPDVQTAAAQALAIMAENLISRDSVREWGKLINTICI